jgi:hypothetical protein
LTYQKSYALIIPHPAVNKKFKDTAYKMAPKVFLEWIATRVQIGENDWDTQEFDDENDYETTEQTVRRVQFSSAVHSVNKIMTRYEYTAKEMKACWYTLEDKAKTNAKHEKTVARFDSGKAPKRGQTYRGLDCWLVEGAREFAATVTRCVDAVMDEQDRQWRTFSDDHDRLAAVSMQISGPSKQLSWEMARLDAQAVAPVVIEEGVYVSSSETGSDALNDIPVPVEKKERRRSEKNNKNHTKKGERKRKDPPGSIHRAASQNASDVLKQMASASHKFTVRKLRTKKSPIRGQGLARTRSK